MTARGGGDTAIRSGQQEDEPTGLETATAFLSTEERQRLRQLRGFLDEAGASYTIYTHDETVTSAEKGVQSGFGELAVMAPTLIVKTERGCMAIIISGETRLSYKKMKAALGLRNISLASSELVLQTTGAEVGTVSMVNQGLPTMVDTRLLEASEVYGGCGVPRHTLRINIKDLIAVTCARMFDVAEAKSTSSAG